MRTFVGLSRDSLPADAGLLAEGKRTQTKVRFSCSISRQADPFSRTTKKGYNPKVTMTTSHAALLDLFSLFYFMSFICFV